MKTISFDTIHRIVADHQRAEEARYAPAAVARRALDSLHDVIDALSPSERDEVVAELRALIDEQQQMWAGFGAALAGREWE